MSEDPILSAIAALRTDFLMELRKSSADLMERMDRLQTHLGHIDEHLTMGLGHTDDVEQRADKAVSAVAESNRIHAEQIRSLQKLVRSLESRVAQLEEK